MQLSQLPKDYLTLLAKLSQLARFYEMGKKLEKFNLVKEKVRIKMKQITDALEEYEQYRFIKEDVLRKLDSTFMEAASISSKKSSSNVSRQSDASNKSSANANSNNSNKVNSDKVINDKMSVQGSIKKANSQTFQEQKPKTIKMEKPKQITQQQIKIPPSQEKKQASQASSPQPKFQKIMEKKSQRQMTSVAEILTPSQSYDLKSQSKGTSNDFSCLNSHQSDIIEGKGVQTMKNLQKIELESISSISGENAKLSPSNSFVGMLQQQNDHMIETPETLNKNSQSDSNNGMSQQDNLSEQQQKFSEGSYCQQMQDSLIKFFIQNRSKLNFDLVFNNELFQHMDKQLDGHVYLFGINKPDSKKITKLYACTIMKFSIAEIYRSEDKFEKEMRDFSNNIRLPLGLIFKGEGVSTITPEHIKFLLNLQSPFPIILVVKNDAAEEGVLCSFNQSIIDRIRITPKKQLSQLTEELKKNIFSLEYREEHYPKDKNKVMTKFLSRVIPNLAQQAPNAIAISGNQCIRQQKHCFIYKLHTKFSVITKTDFNIYFANNNLINARMSFKDKDYQAFKKEVIEGQSKIPIILSVNVGKQTTSIKRQFFELLLESKPKRDPFFFINFGSLTVKKTVVATLQPDLTMEMIRSTEPIQYRNFEKDTILTCCVHVITKSNIKQFEQTQGKADLVEIKPK